MGRIRVVDLKPGTPEWHAWRMNGLGASEAAAILGVSKFQTAYELWLVKTGRMPGFTGNSATERGNEMEAAARATYEAREGFIDAPPICLMHPEVDFIIATLDGLCDRMIPWECKYTSEASHKEAIEGKVPHHYWVQVQAQLSCVPDAPYANYWSHRPDNPVCIRVDHDREFQAKLFEAEKAFWDLVRSDLPPPLTERDAKFLESNEAVALAKQMLELKDSSDKKAKTKLDELKAQMIVLGGHNRVRCGRTLVSKSVTATGKDSYRLTISAER